MSGIVGGAGSKSGIIGETELDFEEGTWTPSYSNVDTSINAGFYTKIGRVVTISGHLACTSSGGSGGIISGLPFSVASAGGKTGGGTTSSYTGTDFDVAAVGFNQAGSTQFRLRGGGGDGNADMVIETSKNGAFSGFYYID